MLTVTVCLIYVPDHHHAASPLFGQRYRDCFWCVCYRSHSKLCVQQMYYYDGILLLLLQEAAAAQQQHNVSDIYFHCQPGGQQQYKSTAVSRWFLTLSSFAYRTTTHSAVYLARSSAVGTKTIITYQKKGKKKRVVVVYPTAAAAAAAARPPQPINRAAVGAVGSCCHPFDCTTHTAVVYPTV